MKEELDKAACEMNGQRVKARLEVSPQRRLLTEAQAAMFFKGLKEAGEDESKVRSFYGKLQISFFVGGLAAKCTRDSEGHADEGWFFDKDVVSNIFTDFKRPSL